MPPARLLLPVLALLAVLVQAGLGCVATCSWPPAAPSGVTATAADQGAATTPGDAAGRRIVDTGAAPGPGTSDGTPCTEHRPCHRAPGGCSADTLDDGAGRLGYAEQAVVPGGVLGRAPAPGADDGRCVPSAVSSPAVPLPAVLTPVAFLGVDRN